MTKNICITALLLTGVTYLKLTLQGNWKYIKPVEGQMEIYAFSLILGLEKQHRNSA